MIWYCKLGVWCCVNYFVEMCLSLGGMLSAVDLFVVGGEREKVLSREKRMRYEIKSPRNRRITSYVTCKIRDIEMT